MPDPVYVQCGLRIRSEFELHLPSAAGDGWDVDVRWGPDIADSNERPPGVLVAEHEVRGRRWYTATTTESGYLVRFHGYGEFVISADLDEVRVRRDPSDDSGVLPILMAGTVAAFLLGLRGRTVVHASAVAVDGVAIAFVGQSGRGKSTLAAQLCVEGAGLITDDVLVLDAGDPVRCVGSASEIRLRPAAAAIAEARPDCATRTTADERRAFTPPELIDEQLPLAAIVVPTPSRTALDIDVRPIPPGAAVFVLLSFPRVYGWRRADVLSRDFGVLGRVATSVPVYEVTIPWGVPFGPDVAPALFALVDPAISA